MWRQLVVSYDCVVIGCGVCNWDTLTVHPEPRKGPLGRFKTRSCVFREHKGFLVDIWRVWEEFA